MSPRFILAVTDFSKQGAHALDRAALLGAEHGAMLTLAYLGHPTEAPPADAANRLEQHARQLAQMHGIKVRATGRLARNVKELLPDVSAADLVVWGAARVRSLRTFFLGQPVDELLRSAQRPVLLARRRAEHPYRKLLVAVDFSQASPSLVELSCAISRAAPIELFHAIDTINERKLRQAEVSERDIKIYREQCLGYARDRMVQLTDSYDARRNRVQTAFGRGDPSLQALVQQQRSGADLIVVGKHPASAFSDLMFESVAARIVSFSAGDDARSDVLIVPHGWQPALGTSAAGQAGVRRIRAGAPKAPAGPNPAALHAGA
ncbi:universal stress protein [Polaromonas sp. CT11-55]|uniref:universal stress protein n=1 Tax=Polaromonas sp. CT11-55 TaxID=3243045 RepID=UPI0039A693EA